MATKKKKISKKIPLKKSTKKKVVKKSLVKKGMVNKQQTLKKQVLKKKSVKKTSKKVSTKKYLTKVEEFSDLDKTVICCVFCDSPSVRKSLLNGKEGYYCLRCGVHHICINEKPLIECKELINTRKKLLKTKMSHNKLQREKKFYVFLDNFYLRMIFRIVSLLLIIGGFVFSFTDFWTGMMFITVGLVSLWTAETLR